MRGAGPGARRWAVPAAAILLLAGLRAPGIARGGEPKEQIRGAIDRGLEIIRRPDLQGDAKKAERRALLRKELFPYFAFDEMARRSQGIYRKDRTPQERQEFVKLFTDLLENSYAGKIEGYKGERITYGKETTDPPYAEVRTFHAVVATEPMTGRQPWMRRMAT